MCYGYSGYSDRWWEDAEERRRLEVGRRHQESERLQRQAQDRESSASAARYCGQDRTCSSGD